MADVVDYPFWEVADTAKKQVDLGHTVHQKFTCAKCGARQTMSVPNQFFMTGRCEECGHVTDIVESGCNYLVIKRAAK